MVTDAIHLEILAMEKRRRLYSATVIVVLLAILISGYGLANEMNSGSFVNGLQKFFEYPGEIVLEAWHAGGAFFPLLLRFMPALIETLNIAGAATLIGGAAAVMLAFLGSNNLGVQPLIVIPVVRRMMDAMRAFPELIIALFLIFILGSGPVPAMIAVAFHTAGALGKLFSEVNENVDSKPIEGLHSCGASWLQRMRFGVLPQVLPNYLSYFMLRFEINVRASAILGFVGAGGIGTELRRTIGWGQGAGAETAALFLLLILSIFVIDQTSSSMRRRLVIGKQAT
ncbi:MAG TPA: phosphonate ABC transporter, permease protein PhnE [Desulforhopalus sp.]|jgi:phosphonate transport system permease protein|nr:phosphonate ABC transporter, permease protein PhnE [Desulforhopalus sp.]